MHNIMKKAKIIIIAVFILILSSCSDGVKIHTVDKSYSTGTVSSNAKIPQISGLSSENLQEAVNEEYETTVSELLADFSEASKKTGDSSTFETNTAVHYNSNQFFSAVTQIDSSTGRNRKNSYRITKNIDTKECIEVKLSDLFSDDSYIDMLNSRIEEEVEDNAEKYSDLWQKPAVSQNQRYYIDGKNLVLFYPPYELSYYERGFVEISLSLEDMSGYLKPEYRKLAE